MKKKLVVLCFVMIPLSYYGGRDDHHYILVTAYNTTNNKTQLNDPHWNSAYYDVRSGNGKKLFG